MPTSPTSSTPEYSSALLDGSKKCHVRSLPSTFHAIPSLILPPACSDVEHPPHNFNAAGIQNSFPSTLTTPSNTGPLLPYTRSSYLLSPPADVPQTHHCVHTVRVSKDRTSICNSGQKLNCTPEFPRTRMSPPFIHHQFQLYSSTQDIPVLELPPSVFDAGCLPSTSDTSHRVDSGLSSPTTPTHINHDPHFFAPSYLQSPLDDIPTLCLPPTLSQE